MQYSLQSKECTTGKGRLKFITYMQTLCIILVVVGHSFYHYPDGQYGYTTLFVRLIYSFHMPAFIFVSGFLLAYSSMTSRYGNHQNFGSFVWKKTRRLLIPYITLILITFIPRVYMNGLADDYFELSFSSLFNGLFVSHSLIIPYFWYVQACFLLLVIAYAVFLVAEQIHVYRLGYLIILALIFLTISFTDLGNSPIFSVDSASQLSIYFWLGIVYASFMDTIDHYICWASPITFVALLTLWLVTFIYFENTWLMWICRLCGVMMIISLSRIMESRKIRVLDHLSGYSYIIFLLSWYFNIFAQQIMGHYTTFPWWVYTALSIFSGIYGPYLIYFYLLRYKHNPVARTISTLLGQSN